ncbi:hypothetical protein F4861DRAFT_537541 [Xylaria intraflava]|nr:hypothetical protein F4861DRAFT_537541 [Xylaria intraflava]
MHHQFDGHGLSLEQLQVKAETAALAGQLDGNSNHSRGARSRAERADDSCDWRGDAPEPELDDLALVCKKNQEPSRPADVCNWRDDEPERHDDELGRVCESDSQAQQPKQRDRAADVADSILMPIPRHKAIDIPKVVIRASDEESSIREGKRPKREKSPRKQATQSETASGPSGSPPEGRVAENDSPSGDKTHSPWIDSLTQMPPAMMEKVNMGIKQVLGAASGILTPSTRGQSPAPPPEKSRKNSALAPETIASHPSDFYIPRPVQSTDARHGSNKKQQRKKRRSDRKARNEARREAKKEARKERQQKRKENKERVRKEKARQRAMKKGGGDLPAHLLQGVQNDDDAGPSGRSGRHGLDRNRDTPMMTDDSRIGSGHYHYLDSSAQPNPPEADWWFSSSPAFTEVHRSLYASTTSGLGA